jgi:hypothetical protein
VSGWFLLSSALHPVSLSLVMGQFENCATVVPRMKTFVNSLSLGSGAILVALLSVAVVWLLCSVLPAALRSLWAVIVPFSLAYCLYWLPVWLGAEPSEFGAWAILGVGAWFLAGYFPSAVVVLILQKRERRIR